MKRFLLVLILLLSPRVFGDDKDQHFVYDYELRKTGAIVGGTRQKYTVDITVTNDGKEMIPKIVVETRIYQTHSTNDKIQTVSVRNLRPGQKVSFPISVTFYNYMYIGKTSRPKVEVEAWID